MAKTVRTMAGPPVMYYLAIDGTEAQDSAVFGALLEGRGWKNLAATYLRPAPDEPIRLVDPAHDFLSVRLIQTNGRQVAVVSPNGANGMGIDPHWRTYPGSAKTPDGVVVEGRYAAAELSAGFMQQLILAPQIIDRLLLDICAGECPEPKERKRPEPNQDSPIILPIARPPSEAPPPPKKP